MRFRIIYQLFAVALSSLIFTSCADEMEVGTTLFPNDGEGKAVKAFIDNYCFYPKNMMQSHLVQAGNGGALIMADDEVSLKVHLTSPAETDLTFSLVVDNSNSQQENEEKVTLTEDAIVFGTQTVVVCRGEMESREDITFSLNKESAFLKGFDSETFISMSLKSHNDVEIVKGYDKYQWKVTKEITNIDTKGDFGGKTQMPFNLYDVMQNYYGQFSPTQDLNDDNMETYLMIYANTERNDIIPVQFHEEQEVVGISIYPAEYWGDWNVSCSKVELLAGSDKEHLQRVGIATWKTSMPTDHTPWEIVFFTPVKMKFMEIRVIDNYSKDDNKTAITFIPEIRIYK